MESHRPALLHAALQRFSGMADWKPRWHILAVPTEAFMGVREAYSTWRRWAKGANALLSARLTVTINSVRSFSDECAALADSRPVRGWT